jgi:hypothetical protein
MALLSSMNSPAALMQTGPFAPNGQHKSFQKKNTSFSIGKNIPSAFQACPVYSEYFKQYSWPAMPMNAVGTA